MRTHLIFLICAAFCNFVPSLFSTDGQNSFNGETSAEEIRNYLIFSIVISIPFLLDNAIDFLSNSIMQKNIIMHCSSILPTFILIILTQIALNHSGMYIFCTIIYQIISSFWGMFLYALSYRRGFPDTNILPNIALGSFCLSMVLNNCSHAYNGTTSTVLQIFSMIFACVVIYSILRLLSQAIEYRDSMGALNRYCYSVCLISMLGLVVGCVILRFVSLFSYHGMSIYINGLIVLSSLCTLPVFMLDGRIARYNAIKNEVPIICVNLLFQNNSKFPLYNIRLC